MPSIFHNANAVIFDLDGTLIDSMGIWNDVDRAVLETLGYQPLSEEGLTDFRSASLIKHAKEENPYIGFCSDLGTLCSSSLTGQDIHKLRRQISRKLLREKVKLRQGVLEALRFFEERDVELAIATTTKRDNIVLYENENKAVGANLSFSKTFSTILTREDISRIKPDPEIFLLALEKLGRLPQECLVFEDSLAGVRAAKQAGIRVFAIEESHSAKDKELIRQEADGYFTDWHDFILRYA